MIDRELQDFVLNKISENRSLNLQIGFSNDVHYIFTYTEKKLQDFVLNKISENSIFALILGSSLGRTQTDIINKNNWISWGIGQRCGTLLQEQQEHIHNEIWRMAETSQSFCDGLSYGIAMVFSSLTEQFRSLLWLKIKENKSFSEGLELFNIFYDSL